MENPYASPSPSPFSDFAPSGPGMPTPGQYPRGMVGHVRVLGILMIVHGVLQVLMGAMYALMSAMFPMMMEMNAAQQPAQQPNVPFEGMPYVMIAVYISMSVAGIVPGFLGCWAGWKLTRFQGRTLGIASLAIGGMSVLTCYCSITAIGLLIYGLIVLMDGSVKQAFELARQGYLPEQIDALFNPWAAPGKLPNPGGPPFA